MIDAAAFAVATDRPPNGRALRELRKALQIANRGWPEQMREVVLDDWPDDVKAVAWDKRPLRAWRSRRFVAMLFEEGGNRPTRLTVHRTWLDDRGRFEGGITWDELMAVKRECGFGSLDALEFYPADDVVVDVQNMRHLWLVSTPHQWVWR
jgi:hypothetical protein